MSLARGALPGQQSTAEGAAHSNSTPLYDQDAFLDAAQWAGMTVRAAVLFTFINCPAQWKPDCAINVIR